MKQVIICGSISATQDMLRVQKILEEKGCSVEIPEGAKNEELRGRTEVTPIEKAEDKIKHDLIRGYFAKIQSSDIVLIVNPEKKGIPGYIGGNTLIEMAFAHVLGKPLYVLYSVPDMPYTAEILGTQPAVLNGDISKLPF